MAARAAAVQASAESVESAVVIRQHKRGKQQESTVLMLARRRKRFFQAVTPLAAMEDVQLQSAAILL